MPEAQQLPFGVQTPPGTHPPHTWWGGDMGHFREPRREIDKVSNFRHPKNQLEYGAYAGHMPGISGWRSRDQAYAGHIPDTGNGIKRQIWGICPAYAAHMPGIWAYARHTYARHMPAGICPVYAQFMPDFSKRVKEGDSHRPGICPAYAAAPKWAFFKL